MGGGQPRLLLLRAGDYRNRANGDRRFFLVARHAVAALRLRLSARWLLVRRLRAVFRLLWNRVIIRTTWAAACSWAERLAGDRTDFRAFTGDGTADFGNTHVSCSLCKGLRARGIVYP